MFHLLVKQYFKSSFNDLNKYHNNKFCKNPSLKSYKFKLFNKTLSFRYPIRLNVFQSTILGEKKVSFLTYVYKNFSKQSFLLLLILLLLSSVFFLLPDIEVTSIHSLHRCKRLHILTQIIFVLHKLEI